MNIFWRNRLWTPFPGSTRREKKGYGASGNLCTDRKVYSIIFPGSRRRKSGTGSIGGGDTGTGRLLGIDSHLTKPLEAKIQLKNLKVSWKLFISYAVLLVLLVAGCAVSIAHLAGLGRQIETFYEGPFIVNDSANIVNSNFERMQKAVYRAIANSDPEITAEAIANARDSAAIIQEQLPVIKEHFLGDKDIIARLEAALTELEPMRKNVLELATLNRREEAADYMEHNNILVIKKAQAELELLIESGKTRGNSLVDGLRSRQRKAVVTLFLLGSISVAVSIVFGIYITRGITRPVAQLEKAARNLAEGKLSDVKIDYQSKDELGVLADDMRGMVYLLSNVIRDESSLLKEMAAGNFNVHSNFESSYVGELKQLLLSMHEINVRMSGTLLQIRQASAEVASGSEQVASGAQSLAGARQNRLFP